MPDRKAAWLSNDVLLVATAGAYGKVMSSDYNLRARPAEDVLDLPAAVAGLRSAGGAAR